MLLPAAVTAESSTPTSCTQSCRCALVSNRHLSAKATWASTVRVQRQASLHIAAKHVCSATITPSDARVMTVGELFPFPRKLLPPSAVHRMRGVPFLGRGHFTAQTSLLQHNRDWEGHIVGAAMVRHV